MHVPLTIKEIQAGYLTSPFFKDLYRYLAQNKLPHKKSAMHKVEALIKKIYPTRFSIIQNNTGQRKSTSGNTRNMCR